MANPPQKNRKGHTDKSDAFDRCQTPGIAVEPLLPYLGKFKRIWEPACGDGLLVEAMREAGLNVLGTDILYGQNFYSFTRQFVLDEGIECIVTNPPYTTMYTFMAHAYALGIPTAFLIPVRTIGNLAAQKLWKVYEMEELLLDQRINFGMPIKGFTDGKWKSNATFPTFWACNRILGQHRVFGHVRRVPKAQLALF